MNQNKFLWREYSLSLLGRIKLHLALNGKSHIFQKLREDELWRKPNLIRNVVSYGQNESCHLCRKSVLLHKPGDSVQQLWSFYLVHLLKY